MYDKNINFALVIFHEAPEEHILGKQQMKLNAKDIDRLSHVFDYTTSTYKFYWMLSLLKVVSLGRGHQPISYNEMVARMLSLAWAPLVQGNFSFGKCDTLIDRINELISHSPLCISSIEERVYSFVMANGSSDLVADIVKKLTKYVPARFLYPWIGTCKDNEGKGMSINPNNRCLYAFDGKYVNINPLWMNYLVEHNHILEGFTYHHLFCFLEQRNADFVLPVAWSMGSTADGSSITYKLGYRRSFSAYCASGNSERIRNVKNVFTFNAPFTNNGGTLTGNVIKNNKK